MSLYIGKDTSDNYVLHTTSDVKAESVLRSGVVDTTTFHSSLPYMELIKTVDVPTYMTKGYVGYSVRGVGAYYYGMFTAEIPASVFPYYLQGYLVVLKVSSRNSSHAGFVKYFKTTAVHDASYYYNSDTHTYSSGGVFVDSAQIPLGGGYYNNNYVNLRRINPSSTPSSTNKYLLISVGEKSSNLSDNIFLQGAGSSAQIDDIDGTGTLYIFNVQNGNVVPSIPVCTGITIDKSNFIINSSTRSLNLSNYSFVSSEYDGSLSDGSDLNFVSTYGNVNNGGLNIFNPSNLEGVGWDISVSDEYAIKKKYADGSLHTLVSNGVNHVKIGDYVSLPIDISYSNSYPDTELLSITGTYKFFLVHISGVYTVNGKSVDVLPTTWFGFAGTPINEIIAHVAVAVTNYQGSDTRLSGNVSVVSSASTVAIRYSSYTDGNSYPLSGNLTLASRITLFT